jgi:hypothetical protein
MPQIFTTFWEHAQVVKMTTNMRVHLASENNSYIQFAEDLLEIGEGQLTCMFSKEI